MRYLHGKAKVNKGGKIAVTISKPTRVLILSEKDFRRYKNSQTFTYYGGAKEDAYEFEAPKSGLWHVVVEKGTYHKPEEIKASISVIKPVRIPSAPKVLASTLDEADEQLDNLQKEEEEETEE